MSICRMRDFDFGMFRITSATQFPKKSNSSCFLLLSDAFDTALLEITSIFAPWCISVHCFISSVTSSSSNVVKISLDVAFANDSSIILLDDIVIFFPSLLLGSSVMIWYALCCFFGDSFSAVWKEETLCKVWIFNWFFLKKNTHVFWLSVRKWSLHRQQLHLAIQSSQMKCNDHDHRLLETHPLRLPLCQNSHSIYSKMFKNIVQNTQNLPTNSEKLTSGFKSYSICSYCVDFCSSIMLSKKPSCS